jgi:hypothetical protein
VRCMMTSIRNRCIWHPTTWCHGVITPRRNQLVHIHTPVPDPHTPLTSLVGANTLPLWSARAGVRPLLSIRDARVLRLGLLRIWSRTDPQLPGLGTGTGVGAGPGLGPGAQPGKLAGVSTMLGRYTSTPSLGFWSQVLASSSAKKDLPLPSLSLGLWVGRGKAGGTHTERQV